MNARAPRRGPRSTGVPEARSARRRLREIVPVAVSGVALGSLTAVYVLGVYLPSFNTAATAIAGKSHQETKLPHTPGLTRELVVVVVDGLGYRFAHELPELSALRRRGVMRPLVAPLPSYTGPSITAMVTGLDPVDSGVRLNGPHDGTPGIDSVTGELARAHVPIEVDREGFEPFSRLVRAPADARVLHGQVAFVAELIERRLGLEAPLALPDMQSPARKVSFVHIEDVDDAGHQHGAASREYEGAAHHAGELVERIAATLDFGQDTLIVLSDHGHRAAGGHGGEEAEVRAAFWLAAGPLMRRGVDLAEARPMRDVASTLSILAGVRAPTSNLGRPMFDVLSVDDDGASVLFAGPFDQAATFSCSLEAHPRCAAAPAIAQRLAERDVAARGEGEALLDELEAQRATSRSSRFDGASIPRTAIALTASLAALVALGRALDRRRSAARAPAKAGGRGLTVAGALAPLGFIVVYAAWLYRIGYRPTFSSFWTGPDLIRHATPAGLLGAALVVAFAWLTPVGRLAPWWTMLAIAGPFAVVAARVGWQTEFVSPLVLGSVVFLLSPAVPGAAAAAIGVAVVNALRHRPVVNAPVSPSTENR